MSWSTLLPIRWYYNYSFSIYGPNTAQIDHVTLIFDLGGHGACGWCGSLSFVCIPSLKFVGLAIRKIWRTMCVSINGPGDFDHLTLKLVCESQLRWETFLPNLGTRRTDGRTKATLIAPFPVGEGIISTDWKPVCSSLLLAKSYLRRVTDEQTDSCLCLCRAVVLLSATQRSRIARNRKLFALIESHADACSIH